MVERRRSERQVLEHPGMGTICVIQDVDITYVDAKECVVIALRSIPHGERLLLAIPDDAGGEAHTRLVRVATSRVVLRGGALRREVRLLFTARPGDTSAVLEQAGSRAALGSSLKGTVIRRVPVRIVEVNSSGCLWESPSSLEDGAVGMIEIRSSRQHHSEAVRILRTLRSDASIWPYRTAVEFLTLGPMSPESFRGVAALAAVGTH